MDKMTNGHHGSKDGLKHGPVLNVIVIGGSSGIGLSIVDHFARNGHHVLGTFFSNEQDSAKMKKKFSNVDYCFLDQGDLDSVEAFGQNVNKWLHTLSAEESRQAVDVLINNAALGSSTVVKYVQSKLAQMNPSESWNRMSTFKQQALEDEALMKVNSLGPLWVTDIILPMLRAPNAAIPEHSSSIQHRNYATVIFIGSVGGSTGVFPEYRASDLMSKSAVSYLSKHLAAKCVHSHIDVMCLAPGATNTAMFRQSTLEHVIDPYHFVQQMPKRRLIEPEEVAQSVYVLSTESWARIFHGAVLDASLGLGARPGVQTENHMQRI